ncbi:MAG TPA: helix-turn-helix domain-containing protein [Acidimicrobiales bacterium]|nr:helix-turn-helix domain-containing protein [Acidimicrobiales bacterium]
MAIPKTLPNLLNIEQLTRHLDTSERHIRRLIAERRIPYIKVGALVRFDPDEIAAWLDQGRHPDDPRPGLYRHTR